MLEKIVHDGGDALRVLPEGIMAELIEDLDAGGGQRSRSPCTPEDIEVEAARAAIAGAMESLASPFLRE
jgi:hypothetical protein